MSIALITELRSMTGAGIADCKKALEASNNDLEKAVVWLREKGIASAVKRADKAAKQGLVHSYIHGGGSLGVLVEVNCETDFVAKTDDFKNLIKEIAMQVAAVNPLYVKREDVSEATLEAEKDIYKAQLKEEKKPEKAWDKIIAGKVEKFYSTICLYEQPYMRDATGKQTVKDLIDETIGKLGENIVVKRFARFKVGE